MSLNLFLGEKKIEKKGVNHLLIVFQSRGQRLMRSRSSGIRELSTSSATFLLTLINTLSRVIIVRLGFRGLIIIGVIVILIVG